MEPSAALRLFTDLFLSQVVLEIQNNYPITVIHNRGPRACEQEQSMTFDTLRKFLRAYYWRIACVD
jgi:hypothetical protein